jgi:hypothetical protein
VFKIAGISWSTAFLDRQFKFYGITMVHQSVHGLGSWSSRWRRLSVYLRETAIQIQHSSTCTHSHPSQQWLQLYLGLSSGVTVTSTQKSRQELAINRRRESLLGQGGASRPAVRPTSYEAGLTACYFGKVVSVVNHVNLQD